MPEAQPIEARRGACADGDAEAGGRLVHAIIVVGIDDQAREVERTRHDAERRADLGPRRAGVVADDRAPVGADRDAVAEPLVVRRVLLVGR